MKYLSAVLLAAYLQVKCSYGCDFHAVTMCTSMLSGGSDLMQSQGLASMPSPQQLATICGYNAGHQHGSVVITPAWMGLLAGSGMLNDFRECYRPNLSNCQNNLYFALTFGTIERIVDYLCEDGFEAIMKHEACWNRSDVTNATKTCYNTQTRDIWNLEQDMGRLSHQQLSRNLCGILDEAQTCMCSSVEQRCGSEAATVMETMMKNTFVEVVLMMECPSDPDDTSVFGMGKKQSFKGKYSQWSSTNIGFSVKSRESSIILFVLAVWLIVLLEQN